MSEDTQDSMETMEVTEEELEQQEQIERPLFQGLREEWESQKFTDVTIFCKNKEVLKSHRIVLACLSSMIRKALYFDPTK